MKKCDVCAEARRSIQELDVANAAIEAELQAAAPLLGAHPLAQKFAARHDPNEEIEMDTGYLRCSNCAAIARCACGCERPLYVKAGRRFLAGKGFESRGLTKLEIVTKVPGTVTKPDMNVYRHYDDEDRLLYVGCSLNPIGRQMNHNSAAPWFERVNKIEIERFATHAEALAAEAQAIRTESPEFNILGAAKQRIERQLEIERAPTLSVHGKRLGRPRLGAKPLSAAERSRRHRAKRRHK